MISVRSLTQMDRFGDTSRSTHNKLQCALPESFSNARPTTNLSFVASPYLLQPLVHPLANIICLITTPDSLDTSHLHVDLLLSRPSQYVLDLLDPLTWRHVVEAPVSMKVWIRALARSPVDRHRPESRIGRHSIVHHARYCQAFQPIPLAGQRRYKACSGGSIECRCAKGIRLERSNSGETAAIASAVGMGCALCAGILDCEMRRGGMRLEKGDKAVRFWVGVRIDDELPNCRGGDGDGSDVGKQGSLARCEVDKVGQVGRE
jgi:hypothetical protein